MNPSCPLYVLLLIMREIMFSTLSRISIFKVLKEDLFGLAVVSK